MEHLNLDDAWRDQPFGLPTVDARNWAPKLRFSAPPRLVAEFYREYEPLSIAVSALQQGDFHYLTALQTPESRSRCTCFLTIADWDCARRGVRRLVNPRWNTA
jgi:hypothetical protein